MAKPWTNWHQLLTTFFGTNNYPAIPEKKSQRKYWVEGVELELCLRVFETCFLPFIWENIGKWRKTCFTYHANSPLKWLFTQMFLLYHQSNTIYATFVWKKWIPQCNHNASKIQNGAFFWKKNALSQLFTIYFSI